MKRLKKILALAIAMAMVLSMGAMTAFAASDYKITVTNSSETVSIDGKTFYAYKLFDATYAGTTTSGEDNTPHAYTISTSNWFYTNADSKAALDQYFDFTASAGDATTMVVTVKDGVTFDDAAAYALGEAIDKAMEAASTKPTATASAQASGTSVTIDTGSAGYYIVTGEGTAATDQTVIAAVALTTTDPTASIAAKVDAPTIDKNIQTAAATEAVADDPSTDEDESAEAQDATYAKNNNASIGDTVSYKLDSKVPDMTGYDQYYFVVTDTLSSGLTLYDASNNDISNVTIKVGNTTLTAATAAQVTAAQAAYDAWQLVVSNNGDTTTTKAAYDAALAALNNTYTKTITVNQDGTTTPKLVINNFIGYKDNQDDEIVITYDAIVDSDAVIGVAGNPNDVKLEYSNNPNKEGEGINEPGDDDDDVTGETPEVKTYTYVTGVKLTKVNSSEETLEGAEFTITGEKVNKVVVKGTTYDLDNENGTYYKLKDGTYTATAPTDATTDQYATPTSNKYVKNTADKVVTTTETVTATARTKSDGTLEFDGLGEGTYTITEILAPTGYNLLTNPIVFDIGWTAPAGNATTCTWTYTKNAAAGDANAAPAAEDVTITNDGLITFNIVNNTGTELPSTGGIGTTIFYVVGAILVIGAGVVLITKRRMEA